MMFIFHTLITLTCIITMQDENQKSSKIFSNIVHYTQLYIVKTTHIKVVQI